MDGSNGMGLAQLLQTLMGAPKAFTGAAPHPALPGAVEAAHPLLPGASMAPIARQNAPSGAPVPGGGNPAQLMQGGHGALGGAAGTPMGMYGSFYGARTGGAPDQRPAAGLGKGLG